MTEWMLFNAQLEAIKRRRPRGAVMNRFDLRALLDRIEIGIDGAFWEIHDAGKDYATGVPAPAGMGLFTTPLLLVRIQRQARDNRKPLVPPTLWPGRWWVVESHHTEAQIVNTLLKAALTYVEHEHRERFLLDGEPVYEPNH